MAELVEFFAQVKDGDIHSITQAIPYHELTENQIELTKEEYYLLKSSKYAETNGVGIVEHLNHVVGMLAKKIGDLEKSQ